MSLCFYCCTDTCLQYTDRGLHQPVPNMVQSKSEFDVWDWLLFGAMLAVSAGIGIFYACIGGRQKTTAEFLMGGRSLQLIPVAISILVSFMSAILILGTPAEMYTQGTQYFMYMFGIILAIILASQLFVPLLYPLQLTSSFEVSGLSKYTTVWICF